MRKYSKFTASALIVAMVASLSACGGSADSTQTSAGADSADSTDTAADSSTDSSTEATSSDSADTTETPSEKRIINVGTWYEQYYTSDHTSIDDNPNVDNRDTAQMQLDNMREIEEKYNVEFHFVNLTWEGTIESINTSIAAGKPDCDIYLTDLQFGIPAVLNGYAQALQDFLPEDADVFNDQVVMQDLNIMDDEKTYLFAPQSPCLDGYPLGFNMDMIEAAGLENPQDLYDKGEWTWDKFREYCYALTVDKDGDGTKDVYGYGGANTNTLNQLLLSNGASICASTTQTVDSPEVIECLQFMYDLYNTDKTAKPWNSDDWDANVTAFADGLVAFWPNAAWITDSYRPDDADYELGIVPWPVGPSGDQETNNQVIVAGAWYMIPTGVEDPEFVYNVFNDWSNWYDGDTSLRDDTSWFEDQMMTERNFDYLLEMGNHKQFDLYGSVSDGLDLEGICKGTKTPSQASEESKQVYQDYLDQYFGE